MRRAAALLVTFAHCCRAAPLPPDDDDLVVELPSLGKLRGTLASQGADYIFRAFKGVPFAEPPVSERRFRSLSRPRRSEMVNFAVGISDSCY